MNIEQSSTSYLDLSQPLPQQNLFMTKVILYLHC